jgi:pilus assembly protein Flp/PilA
MISLRSFLARLPADEDGPTAVEYAVLLAVIIVFCLRSTAALGSNSSSTYSLVSTKADETSR